MELLTLFLLLVASFALAVVGARSVLTLVLHLLSQDENPVALSGPGSSS